MGANNEHKSKEDKYISRTGDGRFRIVRKLNGKSCYFGVYDSLEEARLVKEGIEGAGWLRCERFRPRYSRPLPKYVYFNHGRFHVLKFVDGRLESFGSFSVLEDAVSERDFLVSVGWSYDNLESVGVFDEVVWLNRRVYV